MAKITMLVFALKYKKDLIPKGNFSLSLDNEIFKLYHSGKTTVQNHFVKRILLMLVLSLSALFAAFYFLMSFFEVEENLL